jgi:enterobactin synthetase component F
VFNVYGPTETTVWSSWMRLETPCERRIGVPIQNTQIAIADADGRALAKGESGRILIGGAGLALGYLGQPELTAQKFSHALHDAGMWYDTGDVGFIDADGQLNFVTRAGDFVKVNGHRIELLEVSDALESLPFVAEAAVLCVRDRHDVDTLAAFVKLDPRVVCPDPAATARAELAQLLPTYMQPGSLTVVEDFPRNSAGKLDRKTLAARVPSVPAAPPQRQAAAGTPVMIANLLTPYLDVARLGEHDNLFVHGLTSMHAVSFHLDLAAHWPHVELFHIFENPTLSRLAALVAAAPCEVSI